MYDEYEMTLNARLDDVDALLAQVIDAVNIASGADGVIATALGSEGAIATALGNSTTTIKATLENETKSVGTTLSNAMKGIWSVDEGNAKSVITEYGKGFQDKQTLTNNALDNIKMRPVAQIKVCYIFNFSLFSCHLICFLFSKTKRQPSYASLYFCSFLSTDTMRLIISAKFLAGVLSSDPYFFQQSTHHLLLALI